MTLAEVIEKLEEDRLTLLAYGRAYEHVPLPEGWEFIGQGCSKNAFRIGNWVVKKGLEYDFDPNTCKYVEEFGIQICPTHVYKNWMIQPYLKPIPYDQFLFLVEYAREISDCEETYTPGDLHSENIGVDEKGVFYAFDW